MKNTEVVLRYLHVFETGDLAGLAQVVDLDVIAHGAGHTVRGRHALEEPVQSPGLSACAVQIEDLFAARDRVTVSFTLTYIQERTGRELTMPGTKCYHLRDGKLSSSGVKPMCTAFCARPAWFPPSSRPCSDCVP